MFRNVTFWVPIPNLKDIVTRSRERLFRTEGLYVYSLSTVSTFSSNSHTTVEDFFLDTRFKLYPDKQIRNQFYTNYIYDVVFPNVENCIFVSVILHHLFSFQGPRSTGPKFRTEMVNLTH